MAENKVRILELDAASLAEVKEQGFIPVSVEGKTYKLALSEFVIGKTSELENDAKFVSQSDIGTEYGTDKAGEPVDSYEKFSVVWHNDKMYVATSAVTVERDEEGVAIWDASKWQETTQQELDFGYGHAIRQLSDEMPHKVSDLRNNGDGTEGSKLVESKAVASIVKVTAMPENPDPNTLYLVVEGA